MRRQGMAIPGIVISALCGGAGKTILSLGIASAWREAGYVVAPFKKGPDYIDAGWLALAAGRPCYNLDTFLMDPDRVLLSFQTHTEKSDIAVVEGNRGLFDGIDLEGRTSTAEIAKLLGLPVVLGVDCTKTTRTMAAVIGGCLQFDPDISIAGVILNRVAGGRHENILRQSIEHHCGIPVVGAVPKLRQQTFPERHMGLVPTPEHDWAADSIATAAEIARKHIDLDRLLQIARATERHAKETDRGSFKSTGTSARAEKSRRPVIGVVRDSAFQFYYPDNIAALEAAGAETVVVSPLKQKTLPPLDGLYIGGGFPETHARELSGNRTFGQALKALVEEDFPVYAECGGLMYLGEELQMDGKRYPMTGILPIVFGLSKRPQGHGYTISVVDRANPYFPVGTELRGHEFRYSTVLEWRGRDSDLVFETRRGTGFVNHRDGISYRKVLAGYTHLHASGTPGWAESLVRNAQSFAEKKMAAVK